MVALSVVGRDEAQVNLSSGAVDNGYARKADILKLGVRKFHQRAMAAPSFQYLLEPADDCRKAR
jgi:hypothetical protein